MFVVRGSLSVVKTPITCNNGLRTTDYGPLMFTPQLSNKSLAELCHRLAVETDSGIDIRRTWQRESDIARGKFRPYIASVRDAVARGDSLSSALAQTGSVFPSLFREMADVGEKTGTLSK